MDALFSCDFPNDARLKANTGRFLERQFNRTHEHLLRVIASQRCGLFSVCAMNLGRFVRFLGHFRFTAITHSESAKPKFLAPSGHVANDSSSGGWSPLGLDVYRVSHRPVDSPRRPAICHRRAICISTAPEALSTKLNWARQVRLCTLPRPHVPRTAVFHCSVHCHDPRRSVTRGEQPQGKTDQNSTGEPSAITLRCSHSVPDLLRLACKSTGPFPARHHQLQPIAERDGSFRYQASRASNRQSS